MNRTIKEATVKRYHYETHDQLRQHLTDFVAAYNFARRPSVVSSPMKQSAKHGQISQIDSYQIRAINHRDQTSRRGSGLVPPL
jgi:hypothetical protein